MSHGRVRDGEEARLPIWSGSKLWFLLIWQDGKEESYHDSKARLESLLTQLQSPDRPMKIYAIWHGQHNTDMFSCDRQRLLRGWDVDWGWTGA